ncbi:MAG: hypothetical protein ACYDEY_00620 [Acidimicrobiales bacterium]
MVVIANLTNSATGQRAGTVGIAAGEAGLGVGLASSGSKEVAAEGGTGSGGLPLTLVVGRASDLTAPGPDLEGSLSVLRARGSEFRFPAEPTALSVRLK